MADWFWQLGLGLFGLIGVLATAWSAVKVGKNSDRQKAVSDERSHELGLIDRYQEALESTEARMNRRIDELEKRVKGLQDEVRNERTARRDAESQRDAAVMHAQELRDAWPGSSTVPPPPPLIAQLFTLGSHHQPPGPPGASS